MASFTLSESSSMKELKAFRDAYGLDVPLSGKGRTKSVIVAELLAAAAEPTTCSGGAEPNTRSRSSPKKKRSPRGAAAPSPGSSKLPVATGFDGVSESSSMKELKAFRDKHGLDVPLSGKGRTKSVIVAELIAAAAEPTTYSGGAAAAPAAAKIPSTLSESSSMKELKAFRDAHGLDVPLSGPGRTKSVIVAELITAARRAGYNVSAVAAAAARALFIEGYPGDPPLGYLSHDCASVTAMLRRKGVPVEHFACDTRGGTGKKKVLRVLSKFFVQDAQTFVVCYSGHGDKGEGNDPMEGGAFQVGVAGGDRGLVTFADIVSTWTAAKGRRRGIKLLLVADSCYSGKLVSKLKRLPLRERETLGLAIQSAGNARQMVTEDGDIRHGAGPLRDGGHFMQYWIPMQSQRVRWTAAESHPQFYATWDDSSKNKKKFPVQIGTETLMMYNQPDHR